ncbi:NifB/NifX family molybdenum-iron cluster-binding protein [Peptacetobacter sp.]|uniref:NifB/NifX family molybdenum-iron cluster-binding protein n=1 Tax=Peptacetobacter sp. TaxID=2991975 RepID=UPI00262137EE|nr:NifB/NifX family molybdenum-iron cluster-binding protein [Peptacetobacter sp.]
MKLAIPVDEKNINSEVCISFGRTPYFLIYNTENGEEKYLDNSAIAASAGAGIKASQTIVDESVEILLTPRCGENAAEVLEAGDVKIYRTFKGSAKENIDAFKENKLDELTEIHEGFHGNGGN